MNITMTKKHILKKRMVKNMSKATILLINENKAYIMPEIENWMSPCGEGLKIISYYLINGIDRVTDLYNINYSILKKEYLITDEYDKYIEKPVTNNVIDYCISSDYIYAINNTDSDIDYVNTKEKKCLFKRNSLTIYDLKTSYNIERKNEYRVVLKDEEIKTFERALDFYSRLQIGQYDHMTWGFGMYAQNKVIDREFVNSLFLAIRKMAMPNITGSLSNQIHGSLSITSPKVNINGRLSYEILKTIMHNRSYTEHPEGGNTVNFNEPLSVSNYPFPENETKKENKSIISTTVFKDYHLESVLNSLDVYCCYLSLDLKAMFSYVTNNSIALSLANTLSCYLFSGFDINTMNHFIEINDVRGIIINQIVGYDLFKTIWGQKYEKR